MNRHLIIIDDEKNIVIPMIDFFEDMGWDVISFNSAEKALDFPELEKADCIIVDIRLPGMTGIDFIYEALRKNFSLKFIIYTGSIDFCIPEDLIKHGISQNNVIMKPASSFRVIYDLVVKICSKGAG